MRESERLRARVNAEPPQGTRLNDYNRWLNALEVAEDAIAALERAEARVAELEAAAREAVWSGARDSGCHGCGYGDPWGHERHYRRGCAINELWELVLKDQEATDGA